MISVIIVTYNRKLLLKTCLESILTQKSDEPYEVIVIDNYSSDGTDGLIKKNFGDRVKFRKNKVRMGLSKCKLSGINIATGDIIAFTDDDCLVSENWLNEIKKSLNYYDFVGGATLPTADTAFPWWWRNSLEWLVGINTKPGEKFPPLGSNIAFNKYVLDTIQENGQNRINPSTPRSKDRGLLRIDTESGAIFPRPEGRGLSAAECIKCGQCLPYAEDNYRIKKALASGFSMRINPDIINYHRITKTRLTISYLLKRSYNEGCALASYENRISYLFRSFLSLLYHCIRFLISLDFNHIFRMVSNASYILFYIRK